MDEQIKAQRDGDSFKDVQLVRGRARIRFQTPDAQSWWFFVYVVGDFSSQVNVEGIQSLEEPGKSS
jgi:hypothetical protein